MATINKSTQDQWFIAMNLSQDVFHTGYLSPGQEMETGQPTIEVFQDEQSWQTRKDELGIVEPAEEPQV